MAAQPAQPDDADVIRDALKDEYEIEKELGRGGMAIVFKARDKTLEREVAIKVLPFSLSFDAEFVERFQREARTAGRLEHPNIIPIYRVGKSGRVIYFVMKFIRGKSLSAVIETRGALPVPEIRRMLIEAARALGYAHKHGVVHRDIKPDNIMFDELGQAIVTDFGIAKAQSGARLTGTGMSIGTPHYMSPEQARAQNLDGRSDVYSLGVVAYQCLSGHVPFDGEDSFSIGYKHIMEELPTPSLDTAEQRELFAIIQRMMAKKADDRFQNAEELIHSLESMGGAVPSISVADMSTMPTRAIEPMKKPTAAPPSLAGAATTPLPRASASLGRPAEAAAPPAAPAAPPRPAARPRPAPAKSRAPMYAAAALGVALLGLLGYYFGVMRPAQLASAADTSRAGPIIVPESLRANLDTAKRDTAPVTARDTTPARDTSRARDTATTVAARDTARPPVRRDTATPPPPRVATGTLVLSGTLPPRSRVTVDRRPVRGTSIALQPGLHRVDIAAPGYQPYNFTVTIAANQTLRHNLQMQALVARTDTAAPPPPTGGTVNCELPQIGVRNPGSACYDTRPTPRAAPLIDVPPSCTGPIRQVTVVVRVDASGNVVGNPTAQTRRGDCAAFAEAAAAYVADLAFVPATKNGQPVAAWIQLPVRARQ
jgi:hypothetical protein